MMNLLHQNIVRGDACKISIGDVTQEGPSASVQQSCWHSAGFMRYTSLPTSVFHLLFSFLKDPPPETLNQKVVFVNALRHSDRVGDFAAQRINAIVDNEILVAEPWVKEMGPEQRSSGLG